MRCLCQLHLCTLVHGPQAADIQMPVPCNAGQRPHAFKQVHGLVTHMSEPAPMPRASPVNKLGGTCASAEAQSTLQLAPGITEQSAISQ